MKTKKYLIAFDTICDGWQCELGEDGKPNPTLYNSPLDAMKELFEDAVVMLINQTVKDRKDAGITEGKFKEMKKILEGGNAELMKSFLDKHPECNYNDEFIIPSEEFLFGRKVIFTGSEFRTIGKKL